MRTVYFVTSAAHAALTPDDRFAVALLEAKGVSVRPLVWTDPVEHIAPGSVLVLRSVWDYHIHTAQFLAWLSDVEASGHAVLNVPALVRWNVDKRYLRDLAAADVPIIPTYWADRGDSICLAAVAETLGGTDFVVKPAISASALDTHRLDVQHRAQDATRLLADLQSRHDLLIQPYLPEITSEGEWSVLFFGGQFSHAVRKRPAPADFRVQSDFGGTATAEPAPVYVRQSAEQVMSSLPHGRPLYARIDGVDVGGRFLLMEAECIDPVLFLQHDGHAPARFVDAILTYAD